MQYRLATIRVARAGEPTIVPKGEVANTRLLFTGRCLHEFASDAAPGVPLMQDHATTAGPRRLGYVHSWAIESGPEGTDLIAHCHVTNIDAPIKVGMAASLGVDILSAYMDEQGHRRITKMGAREVSVITDGPGALKSAMLTHLGPVVGTPDAPADDLPSGLATALAARPREHRGPGRCTVVSGCPLKGYHVHEA